jgi:hypothetical protein
MDAKIAAVLNREGFVSARGDLVNILRRRWAIPTVKINRKEPNPVRWPDGAYSVQRTADVLGITPLAVFKWMASATIA